MITVPMVSDPGKAGVLQMYAAIVSNECWLPLVYTQGRLLKIKTQIFSFPFHKQYDTHINYCTKTANYLLL